MKTFRIELNRESQGVEVIIVNADTSRAAESEALRIASLRGARYVKVANTVPAHLSDVLKYHDLSGTDCPIVVRDRNTTLNVSPRYIEGGWKELLGRVVLNYGQDEYGTIIFELADEEK